MSHEYGDNPVTKYGYGSTCLDLALTSRIGIARDFAAAVRQTRRWPSQSEHGKVQSDGDL